MTTDTRVDRFLSAAEALPAEAASLFKDLFIHQKSDEQVCRERSLTRAQLEDMRNGVMRSLRAASA